MQILREKVKKLTDEHVAIGKAEAELQAASVAKLGDGDFVGHVLASAEEAMEKRSALRTGSFDLGRVASRVSKGSGGHSCFDTRSTGSRS